MGREMHPFNNLYVPTIERMPYDCNWTQMKKLAHFILWAKLHNIPNGKLTNVSMRITEREKPGGLVVYKRDNLPYDGCIDHDEYTNITRILHKFERLWPCAFLAREYSPDGV